MTILSADDRTFWEKNGYVVIPNAVPPENLTAVIDRMWDFLEMDRNNPDDWYKPRAWHRQTGMVELYHDQALWNNRQHPRVHQIFSEIFDDEKLWVSLDRANMNPPARQDWDYKGFIHWDFDPTTWPIGLRVQGVLCLTDTDEAQGGFQCIPGSHHQVPDIVAWQAPGTELRRPDIGGMTVKPIPGKAGDLVIWHTALLHGNGRNNTDRPRLAQYITMFPEDGSNETLRQRRIELWEQRLPPDNRRAFPGDPRRLEEEFAESAQLTDLGKKLVGLERW